MAVVIGKDRGAVPTLRAALVAIICTVTLLFSCCLTGCDSSADSASVDSPTETQTSEGTDSPSSAEAVEDTATGTASKAIVPAEDEPVATIPAGSSFSITFLEVGQGDAAMVQCDGRYMLVDGGDASASSLMYSYCKNNGIENLDYLVATHPDTDHTGGISGVLQVTSVGRAFCSVTEASQKSFNSMVRYLGNQGVSLEVPSAGDTWQLGSASVQVVGPVVPGDESNDKSLMLRIDYGSTSFLLTGDASDDEERNSVNAGYSLDCDVLKVAHHGSAHSSCYAFLRAVMPTYSVISVGADNSYGHPTDEALSRLRDCGTTVYRTDLQGDIVAVSDGTTVTMTVEKNPTADTLIAPGAAAAAQALSTEGYIGNMNSHKFHLPTCRTLPKEKNRTYFATRQDAIDAGYTPCGNCNP